MSYPPRTHLLVCLLAGLSCTSLAIGQTITGLSPSSVQAGSGGFVLTVGGSNFNSESKVELVTSSGVQTLQTYFINANLLMAGVYSGDVLNPGTVQVEVANYSTQSNSAPSNLYVLAAGSGSGSGSGTGSGTGSGS